MNSRTTHPAPKLKSMLTFYLGALLAVLLVGNFVLNVLSARHYLQEQLQTQADDAATALGMSLSSVFEKSDEVAASSVIDAMFDRGYYAHIILWDASGEAWIVREAPRKISQVPDWFPRLIELDPPVATSDVVRGWSRLGSVSIKINPGQAYLQLWKTLRAELAWFGFVFILAMLALLRILSGALRPIESMVGLARAVMNRDFSVRAEETGARELQQVAQSMNLMATRLELIFDEQLALIDTLRAEVHLDPVTHLLNRTEMDRQLVAELESRDDVREGNLFLLQIRQFDAFNQTFGREAGDQLLQSVAEVLKPVAASYDGALAGRRSGADFCLYLPGISEAEADRLASELLSRVTEISLLREWGTDNVVHIGVASSAGQTASILLANADMALRKAQSGPENGWMRFRLPEGDYEHLVLSGQQWHDVLLDGLNEQRFALVYQPVFATQPGQILYYKALSRLSKDGEWLSAGVFMPMIERFSLQIPFDRLMTELAVRHLVEQAGQDHKIGVTLSTASAIDPEFLSWMSGYLEENALVASRLVLEIPEFAVQKKADLFASWLSLGSRMGMTVVVDKFGLSSLPFSYLKGYDVRWLKIDRHFIEGIDRNRENRFYVKSIIQIAHSLQIKVIAFGVETGDEWTQLLELRVDAGAGYGLQAPVNEIPPSGPDGNHQ